MNVLVLGLGISGKSAVPFLEAKGAKVFVYDDKEPSGPIDFSILDLVIVSPGIAYTHPYYQKAVEQGIEVIGEAELAFRYINQPCLAITGTNGKTTVTALIEHVLNCCGIKAKALGNIGIPLTSYVPHPEEILVVELSSYQLETMTTKVFDAGVILNITPDHLDRYQSMEEYAAAKCRLENCIKPGGTLYIYEEVEKEYKHLLKNYKTYGGHNFEEENIMAARLLCNVKEEDFLKALATFKKPSHRVEFVKEIQGIRFYDDSKGTNIDAVIKAVNMMKGEVVLIAGGVDKGSSYVPWKKHFFGKVKKIIVIGQAADKIYQELIDDFDVERESSLQNAVERAKAVAARGDSVLLSPGCASFDMFKDYAHRGDQFKKYVMEMPE